MSHTRVKTTYEIEGAYGSTQTVELYCHHNHSCDCTTFFNSKGEVESLFFCDWSRGNDLWNAVQRLMFPFKDERGAELKEGVEYYFIPPWEIKENETQTSKFIV